MFPKSTDPEFYHTCPCDPNKAYTLWNWTRHTTSCSHYREKIESEQAERLQQAKEQFAAEEQASIELKAAEEAAAVWLL